MLGKGQQGSEFGQSYAGVLKQMTKTCLVCDAAIEPFMSFGQMPQANGFLLPDDFQDEYLYDLQIGLCDQCGMVQLTEQVEPDRLFHENYAYFSSISTRMEAHFEDFAADVMARYVPKGNPFIVELGSNDGILLRHFSQAGVRHLGIEPSANVAQVAVEKGVNTRCAFFEETVARDIVSEHGQADVVMAANVMCHIPDLGSAVQAIRLVLKPDGVVIFEDPYLGNILEKTAYDQIYDEHVFYFSLTSVQHLFHKHGYELVDVAPQNVHGGSMRYTIAAQGQRAVSQAVTAQLVWESGQGLACPETFDVFRRRVEHSCDALVELLQRLARRRARVVGYGATSKSTTVTNYCGITPDVVEFVSDTTPGKQGKFTPGAHLPVRPYADFSANYPDYALLFAWNHADEIMAKEKEFRDAGGKWIIYVPEVTVL